MPYLDRDGVKVFYEVTGAPRARPALLLTHGYSATADMWKANLPALSADRLVITWDIRGHGRSDSPPDPSAYSKDLSVADMAAVLDAAGVELAVVGGLSLGGYLSLAFHLRHPSRVAALVLCDCGPGYRRDDARQQWNALAARYAENFESRGLEALGAGAEVRTSQHRSAEGLALAARGILAQRDARVIESLSGIAVPVLVLAGADDEPFLAATDMMAAKIPGAEKILIPGAGHAANIDQPERFDEAVVGFLERL